MSTSLDSALLLALLSKLEALRKSQVLILSASHLEIEMLPVLYEQLLLMRGDRSRIEKLDVVLQCRGGVINGARRIALLLRDFAQHLTFIVPHYCESSGTLLSLVADEIIAGDLAIFSPIDPHLNGSGADGEVSTFSAMDIQLFAQMAEDWFGFSTAEARTTSLTTLCQSISPPALTAFYRSYLEVQQIGEELLVTQRKQKSNEARSAIVKQLLSGFHSHYYALTSSQMQQLGLTVQRDEKVEQIAWQIAQHLSLVVGGSLRQSVDEPWYDVLMISREQWRMRERRNDGFMPRWQLGYHNDETVR